MMHQPHHRYWIPVEYLSLSLRKTITLRITWKECTNTNKSIGLYSLNPCVGNFIMFKPDFLEFVEFFMWFSFTCLVKLEIFHLPSLSRPTVNLFLQLCEADNFTLHKIFFSPMSKLIRGILQDLRA